MLSASTVHSVSPEGHWQCPPRRNLNEGQVSKYPPNYIEQYWKHSKSSKNMTCCFRYYYFYDHNSWKILLSQTLPSSCAGDRTLLGTLLVIFRFFTVITQGFNIKKQCGWDFVKTILIIWKYQFGVASSAFWHTSYLNTVYKAWIMISLGVNLWGKCFS